MAKTNSEVDRTIVEEIKEKYKYHLKYSLAKDEYTATTHDKFLSLAYSVRDRLIERWIKTQQQYYDNDAKRVYYLSLEFLMGRALGNSLINLKIFDECRVAMEEIGLDLEELREEESDAGLGNGGLGRLAACFLDSMATLQYPAYGYGIRYDYGIFNQKIVNGYQVEEPDDWLRLGNPWEIERPEFEIRVQFYGHVRSYRSKDGRTVYKWEDSQDVLAIPYDIPIPGFDNNTVNTLRLWSAKSTQEFDLQDFNLGNYLDAVEDKIKSENIAKVLYPNDITQAGKVLRLKQQYFFVAASLRDIIRRFRKFHEDFSLLPEKVAVQLNDTHPVIAIPELMRILLDEYELPWEQAWDITNKTFAYTNHTLLPEAMEKWPVSLFERLFPRHMQIIYQINYEFLSKISMLFPGDVERLRRMSIIDETGERYVRMAFLAIIGTHSTNGVAALHSELLKTFVLKDYYEVFPERFNNKTNGITQRRWLLKTNRSLSKLISDKIGDSWIKDLYQLTKIEDFLSDKDFMKNWQKIKLDNKVKLAEIIKKDTGIVVNPESIFDVHIKRLHEYKRQLLNILHVISIYIEIKSKPEADYVPRTFIFGAKAAPGYFMAKLIIKLINNVGAIVNNDPDVGDRLKVVFLPNYRISLAEKIFPAADVSEQVSTAGKEASGTGNMKFALNGALTVGTLDGANVEIKDAVGDDNIFIFGLTVEEVNELKANGYNPRDYYEKDEMLKKVIDLISCGFFSTENPGLFQPIIDSLMNVDQYMHMADFDSYRKAHMDIATTYSDKAKWAKMSVINVARVGMFSSDRTIKQYAEEIWGLNAVPISLEKSSKTSAKTTKTTKSNG
jgi:starch phosphorylase